MIEILSSLIFSLLIGIVYHCSFPKKKEDDNNTIQLLGVTVASFFIAFIGQKFAYGGNELGSMLQHIETNEAPPF
jgi:asparagine N-glycosylation enzyme membrane subunit Stt3